MKQGKINFMHVFFIAAAIFVIAWAWTGHNPLSQSAAGTSDSGKVQVQVTSDKNTATDTTVTVGPEYDKLSPNVAATSVQHYVVVNDKVGSKKNITDSGTFSAAPGDKLQVYYAMESNVYYHKQGQQFTIPDTGALNTVDKDGDQGLYNRMDLADFSTVVRNSDGDKMNTEANQSIAAGETVNVDFEIKSTSNKEAFSPYKPGLILCLYNASADKDFYVTVDGTQLTKFSGDVMHIATGAAAFPTQLNKYIAVLPEKKLVPGSSDRITGTVYITAQSATGGGAETVNCSIVDADWYQDSDTGAFVLGYENASNQDVGGSDYSFNIYLT